VYTKHYCGLIWQLVNAGAIVDLFCVQHSVRAREGTVVLVGSDCTCADEMSEIYLL